MDLKKKTGTSNGRSPKRNLFASSVILKAFSKLSSVIYRKLSTGFFAGVFTAYPREDAALSESLVSQGISKLDIGGRVSLPAKKKLAGWAEDSFFVGLLKKMLGGLLSCPMKTYGIFLFSFAFYSAVIYLFRYFYLTGASERELDAGFIVTAFLMLIASVVMISSRHCLAGALRTSPAARFLLFDIVGLRPNTFDGIETGGSKFHIAFFFGLLFGVASYVIDPLLMIGGILALVVLYLIILRPEFGVLAIITALPFLPTMVLVAAVLYTAVCYGIKVLIGKRSLKLDLLDITVLFFMLLMIGGGVFSISSESLKPMLVYVAFMVGYFLAVNLIRSKQWAIKCVIGAVISCTLTALYGLYQNFFGTLATTWQDVDMFSQIEGRVVSTFENPNVLAEYLIMMLPLMLVAVILSKKPRARFALLLATAATGGCLVYTWSRGAWLGFLIGMLIFLLLYSKKTLTALLLCLLGVPFLPFVLPDSIVQRFTSIGNMGDSSTSYRVNIWRGVIDMLGDFWQSGIGIGYRPFREIYPFYSLEAIEAAPHSHNLYLQITVELGIVGLLVFIALLFFYTQSSLSLHKKDSRREALISTAIFCGILSVLAQGMTDYIWYNYRVFLMFWLLIGLGVAVRRILTNEVEPELI